MDQGEEIRAFGGLLRDIRETVGMSRKELAEKVGCKYEDIRLYEKGERVMRLDRLFRILHVLGVHLSKDLLDIRMYESAVSLNFFGPEKRKILLMKIHEMIAKEREKDEKSRKSKSKNAN